MDINVRNKINVRKSQWRKVNNEKVRKERIISGYIEIKHRNIYNEATEFYNVLNDKYPNKHDLRKTNEYMCLKTGDGVENIKKYYIRKSRSGIKETVKMSNLELKIPLMSQDTIKSSKVQEPVVESTEPEIEKAIAQHPNMPAISEPNQDPTIEPVEIVIDETCTNIQPTLDEDLPSQLIEEIMDRLREDPFLQDYFSDMDITIDETNPLEDEDIFW